MTTEAFEQFLRAYPAYAETTQLDELRATEYARLDQQGHIYLDYTGGGLYADCQIRDHLNLLSRNVYGNPHSINPTSCAMTQLGERARAYVLEYFNADPDEYLAIFTPNASGALKLVGESYPFGPGSRFLLLFDNHNSVVGIREFARARGATCEYIPVVPPHLRVDAQLMTSGLDRVSEGHKLLAYPAQSNFSGVQHSLTWIETAQAKGWDVLVDCASFVPTNRLDLGRWHPDFVPLSFYKVFGYPTGIGCLLARKAALSKLVRPWFAGGTIWAASLKVEAYRLLEGLPEAFEDGTVNYLGLPAVEIGLRHINSIGIDTIHERVLCLTGWLLEQLGALRHNNGRPATVIYGPPDCADRGGTVAFNFLDPDGAIIDERVIGVRLGWYKLSLRTGCFCNPGVGEVVMRLEDAALTEAYSHMDGMTYEQLLSALGMPTGGAVRVSLGLVSNFADAYRFMQFAQTFVDTFPSISNLPLRTHC